MSICDWLDEPLFSPSLLPDAGTNEGYRSLDLGIFPNESYSWETRVVTEETKSEEDSPSLPGFRFHPTDEELVGFYLRRKVEKKPLCIDLIKQIDIYKYDPWDLPRPIPALHESYYFVMAGKKHRDRIRRNRGTGSGFWEAVHMDEPIHSKITHERIGLKTSLVYHRVIAQKALKTDWMMNEFRLVPAMIRTFLQNAKNSAVEAEVWRLCHVFKQKAASTAGPPIVEGRNKQTSTGARIETCSLKSANCNHLVGQGNHLVLDELNFEAQDSSLTSSLSFLNPNEDKLFAYAQDPSFVDQGSHLVLGQLNSEAQDPSSTSWLSFLNPNGDNLFADVHC